MPTPQSEKLFPFDSFRNKQHIVIEEAMNAFDEGYDNVVVDGPVGTGKSAINVTLLRWAGDGFYTTPVKSLREQLQQDEVLQEHVRSLKARKDYTCGVTGENCKDCPINKSEEDSCFKTAKCTYANAKRGAIGHDIAVITFAFLIVDSMMPDIEELEGITFDDRNAIVVDEAQNLIQQVASMHAGFPISPFKLPRGVFGTVTENVPMDASLYEDVEHVAEKVKRRCEEYAGEKVEEEMSPAQKRCKRLAEKIEFMQEQVENDSPWVVDVVKKQYKGEYVKTLVFSPIHVSSFLQNFVWNRGEKRIISTATLPYRGNPSIWLQQVGLDPDNTKILSVSMPFPKENRPIHTHTMIDSFSSGGDKDNWDEIMETLDSLSKTHYSEKGLVHTSSYSRAKRVEDSIRDGDYTYLDGNVFIDEREDDTQAVIEDWQASNCDLLLSPAVCEGVDLPGSQCTWQVLLKVPYPSRDSRTEYLIENTNYGWADYFERALIRVVQSYGRAIRSDSDKADYYVLDEDFNKLMKKRTPPGWFTEAIGVDSAATRSIFDY